jgi:hypothetical protein
MQRTENKDSKKKVGDELSASADFSGVEEDRLY